MRSPSSRASRAAPARVLLAAALIAGVTMAAPAASAHEPSLWLTQEEIDGLSADGDSYENVKRHADGDFGDPNLSNRNHHGAHTYAAALMAARHGSDSYRARVTDALRDLIDRSTADDALAACRKLVAYPIAADLIGLPAVDPALDGQFREWLDWALNVVHPTGGGGAGSVISKHEDRPNNVGTHCGASRLAASLYLGDTDDVERAVQVWRGWAGEPDQYAGFRFGSDLSWQADPDNPVGINPVGAVNSGLDIDGVAPDDQRRCDSFQDPPCTTNYTWEAQQGSLVAAELMRRAGYDGWGHSDEARLRAFDWHYRVADPPAGRDAPGVAGGVDIADGPDNTTQRAQPPGKQQG
jgi:hypothetical protein